MTLVDLLADDLAFSLASRLDGAPRRVLLWLDPEAQFARLSSFLESALAAKGAKLFRFDPETGLGQLAIELELLRLEAVGAMAVVYLPGFDRPALEPRSAGTAPELCGVYE